MYTGKHECQDCGETCKRRQRCINCGALVCGYCNHHYHNLPHNNDDEYEAPSFGMPRGYDDTPPEVYEELYPYKR